MATFYKYAERNAQSQINWAEVGRNITDTLREEARIREEKIATIDENTRQLGITIENNPQGEHEGLNQWSLDYASSAQEMRLIQDRLLRSGQLNLRDYTKMRQNLSDGTDGIFSALEEYQTEYTDKMERMRKGDSQPLETWLMAQAEGLSNFKNHKPVIDPMTSQVYIGKIEDGELVKDPNTYVSVSSLRNRIKGKFDMFKADDYAEQVASGFGVETFEVAKRAGTTWGKILSKQGIRGTVNDKDQAAIDAYRIAENAAIDSAFANPYNLTSLLSVQSNYTFTWDPNAAAGNANLILLKNDPQTGYPVPDFDTKHGPKQKEAAKELLRNIIRSKMDKKTEEKTFSITQVTPRATDRAAATAAQNAKDNVSMIGRLYTGQDLQTALTYFRDRLGAKSVVRDGSDVIVTKSDNTTVKIPFKDNTGTLIPQDKFIEQASALLLDKDESADVRGLAQAGGISLGDFNPTAQGTAKVEDKPSIVQKHNAVVDTIKVPSDEDQAVTYLEGKFGAAGFSFDTAGWGDNVEITDSKGNKKKFETSDTEGIKAFIKNNFNPLSDNANIVTYQNQLMAAPSPSPSPKTKEDQSINYSDYND